MESILEKPGELLAERRISPAVCPDISLSGRAIYRMEGDCRGVRLICLDGTLWITQAGDPNDYLLSAGQSFTVMHHGDVLVQSLPEGRLLLSPMVRASVEQGLCGLGADAESRPGIPLPRRLCLFGISDLRLTGESAGKCSGVSVACAEQGSASAESRQKPKDVLVSNFTINWFLRMAGKSGKGMVRTRSTGMTTWLRRKVYEENNAGYAICHRRLECLPKRGIR